MRETPARLLQLLALLQTRRHWSGPGLAQRLDVTVRTVRRDVDRLRMLGYPVEATRGADGGYRLGRGATLPPLLLSDEEAVAVTVALRAAATLGVTGLDDTALLALIKLDQLLPNRLRRRAQALSDATATAPARGAQVDTDTLLAVAATVRDRQQLRVDYRDHAGALSRRTLHPQRIVHTGNRWYLLAWDLERNDWRSLRLDRLEPRIPTGPTFSPRRDPEPDAVSYVMDSVRSRAYDYRCQMTVHAPAETIADRLGQHAAEVTPLDQHRCHVTAGANDLDEAALWLARLGADVTVHEPAELRDHLHALARRFARSSSRPEVRGGTRPDTDRPDDQARP